MNKKLLIGLCIFLLAISPAYAWDDANYGYRKAINTSGSTNNDYQVVFNWTYSPNQQADMDDFKCYSEGGVLLNHWVENKSDSEWAYIWLKMDTTTASTIKAYCYYGYVSATSLSNIDTTMLFGDDFNDASVNASKWAEHSSLNTGTMTESGGEFIVTGGAANYELVHGQTEFSYPVILEGKIKMNESGSSSWFGLDDRAPSGGADGGIDQAVFFYSTSSQYRTMLDGSATATARADSLDTYKRTKIEYISTTSTKFYITDMTTPKWTSTGDRPTDNMGVYFAACTVSNVITSDWLFIRKYNTTEPTISIGIEENQTGNTPPSITINTPGNTTYYTTSIPVNITVSDTDSPAFWCAIYNDGVLLQNETTNTTYTTTLTKTGGAHNVSVHCDDYTVTSDDAEYYYVFMGLNVSLFDGGTGATLTSWNIYATNGTFNYSDTGLTNPTLIDIFDLPTGSVNITFEKPGGNYQNSTYTHTLNNSALVELAADVYYNQYFYIRDIDTDALISSSNIELTNGTNTTNGNLSAGSVTFGLDVIPWGTVNITGSAFGYAPNTTEITINGSSQISYTTYLRKAGLYLEAKDEETYAALTFNITILNSTTSETWTEQTAFNKDYTQLATGYITIKVTATDYPQRNYYATMTQYTALSFDAYLLKETTGHNVAMVILNNNDVPLQSATVTATKFINGSWVSVEQGETDSSGTTNLFLDMYTQYKIKIEHGDIVTFYRTLTPSANSYTFRVSGQIELNFYNLFEGISYSIIPIQNSILTEQTNLSFVISSATGELEYFGYIVEDNDHNEITTGLIDSSPSGAEMIYELDISALNYSVGDNIYFYTYFKRADTDEATYTRYWINKTYVIWIYTDSNTTIIDALDQFSAENTSELAMLFIATMIMALSLGGLGVMIQRVDVAMLVALMELGVFVMIGWVPFFAGSVAGLFGIIILFSYVMGG